MSPEQAQDLVYHHLSLAEAHRFYRQGKLAFEDRTRARAYRHLIRTGRTTTPEQAVAKAAAHRRNAEAYERLGYTRFVPRELERAAELEAFALRAARLRTAIRRERANEQREWAARAHADR